MAKSLRCGPGSPSNKCCLGQGFAAALLVASFATSVDAQRPDTTSVRGPHVTNVAWGRVSDTTGVATTPTIQTPVQPAATQGSQSAGPVSPLGAFLRALAVPGWGHASVGAYGRGAFYVLVDGGTGWMLFKTVTFVRRARELERGRTNDVLRNLQSQSVTNPDSINAALEDDAGVLGARRLVTAREQQLEDWIALTAFFFLLEGADAYVSAHLAGFPEPVAALRADHRVELGVRIPLRLLR